VEVIKRLGERGAASGDGGDVELLLHLAEKMLRKAARREKVPSRYGTVAQERQA
jgi:hypothetical protein